MNTMYCEGCNYTVLLPPDNRVTADIINCTISRGRVTIKVHRRIAEFASILLDAAPHTIRYERLLTRLVGSTADLDAPLTLLSVYACKLRRILKPLGLGIKSEKNIGYRIVVIPDALSICENANAIATAG